jgi:hypothetical protein
MGWFILSLIVLASSPLDAQTMKQRQQREVSEKMVEIRLNEVHQKAGSLSMNSEALGDEAKKELQRLTEELKTRREMAGRKLGEMRAADSRSWERLKAEANAAVDDLNRIYDRIQSLKNETRR